MQIGPNMHICNYKVIDFYDLASVGEGKKRTAPFQTHIDYVTWGRFRKPGMANTHLIPEKNQFSFEMVQRRPDEPKRIPNGQWQLD